MNRLMRQHLPYILWFSAEFFLTTFCKHLILRTRTREERGLAVVANVRGRSNRSSSRAQLNLKRNLPSIRVACPTRDGGAFSLFLAEANIGNASCLGLVRVNRWSRVSLGTRYNFRVPIAGSKINTSSRSAPRPTIRRQDCRRGGR